MDIVFINEVCCLHTSVFTIIFRCQCLSRTSFRGTFCPVKVSFPRLFLHSFSRRVDTDSRLPCHSLTGIRRLWSYEAQVCVTRAISILAKGPQIRFLPQFSLLRTYAISASSLLSLLNGLSFYRSAFFYWEHLLLANHRMQEVTVDGSSIVCRPLHGK